MDTALFLAKALCERLATFCTQIQGAVMQVSLAASWRQWGIGREAMRARRLGLALSQLPTFDAGTTPVQLAPVAVEDLLLRPSVRIDYQRLEAFIAGKSIVVTGGGGSIGAEICERMLIFGAARLLVLDDGRILMLQRLELFRVRLSYGAPDHHGATGRSPLAVEMLATMVPLGAWIWIRANGLMRRN